MFEETFKRVLEDVLSRVTEFSVASGDATDGSTTTLEDTSAVWEVNKWADAIVEITDVSTGKHYYVTITSNTADTLTFPAIAVTVVDGDHYEIRMPLRLADVTDRAARLLGVVYGSQAQQILQRAATYDLLIQLRHAGVEIDPRAIRALTAADVVDLSNKWARQLGLVDISRVLGAALSATNPVIVRLTDGTAVITSPIKTQLPAALTASGNLKQSIEEAAIAVPADIQARYYVKSTRSIASPAIDTDYWLPATGSLDLSNFFHSSWYIYAPTEATMTIDNCELHISMDGGTTFYKAEGYSIADGAFVRDVWNSIDVPLMLCHAKLKLRFGTAAPASAEMAVIRKA